MPIQADANPKLLEELLAIDKVEDFAAKLRCSNCNRCSLSKHDNQPVIFRGNPKAKILLIGEAPGLYEDRDGIPFVGPAGELLNAIFGSIGIDTDQDMYLGNIVKCRPVAEYGSKKQNYTPLVDQRHNCLPYILHEIKLVDPKVVIMCGLTAARSILGVKDVVSMNKCSGCFIPNDVPELQNRLTFIMYHPAAILHASSSGEQAVLGLKRRTWADMQILRDRLREEKLL